jgi:hypothetical protein
MTVWKWSSSLLFVVVMGEDEIDDRENLEMMEIFRDRRDGEFEAQLQTFELTTGRRRPINPKENDDDAFCLLTKSIPYNLSTSVVAPFHTYRCYWNNKLQQPCPNATNDRLRRLRPTRISTTIVPQQKRSMTLRNRKR